MKKLLLLAAVAMAFGASAQTLTLDWKHETANAAPVGDARQGVGMNGKIYIHIKGKQGSGKVISFDQAGLTNDNLPGGDNCGLTCDQAGNLVVSNAPFPNAWRMDTVGIKVYNPATPDVISLYNVPESLTTGRCDFLGKAEGDLTGDGILYWVGNKSTGMDKFVTVGGEVSADDCYAAQLDAGFAANTTTVINPFMENDVMKYLYYVRNTPARIIVPDGDNYVTEKVLTLPSQGASNGAEIFILGGEKYILYPAKTDKAMGTNYLDAFAIAKVGAEAYTVLKEEELTVAPNSYQSNWLNAEVVDEYTANIYQYMPGSYCAKYTFSLPHEGTGISDVTAKKAEVKKVIENGQIYIINGDAKYNVMGAQAK